MTTREEAMLKGHCAGTRGRIPDELTILSQADVAELFGCSRSKIAQEEYAAIRKIKVRMRGLLEAEGFNLNLS